MRSWCGSMSLTLSRATPSATSKLHRSPCKPPNLPDRSCPCPSPDASLCQANHYLGHLQTCIFNHYNTWLLSNFYYLYNKSSSFICLCCLILNVKRLCLGHCTAAVIAAKLWVLWMWVLLGSWCQSVQSANIGMLMDTVLIYFVR